MHLDAWARHLMCGNASRGACMYKLVTRFVTFPSHLASGEERVLPLCEIFLFLFFKHAITFNLRVGFNVRVFQILILAEHSLLW